MNRRHFCKIASLAAASVGLGRFDASAGDVKSVSSRSGLQSMPASCRVTVIRRECHSDLQALFLDDPDAGPCPLFESGKEFSFRAGDRCPAGFCPQLWATVCGASPSDSGCSPSLEPAVRLLACPDGTRPVLVRVDFE